MAKQYFYIARFDGKHARIPKGYEVRFTSPKLIPNLEQLNKATSNKFYNEVTEAAMAQGMDTAFNIDRNVIKGLATQGHFLIDAPALREEYEKKKKDKEEREEARRKPSEASSQPAPTKRTTSISSSKSTPRSSRHSGSAASGGSCLFAIFGTIFYLLKRLFFSSWKWDDDASVFGKVWHVVKVVFRLAMICLVLVLVLVLFIIISSAIKESK